MIPSLYLYILSMSWRYYMAEEKEFVHPYTKLFNFRTLMNNIPGDKLEEISDHFVELGWNIEQSIVAYVTLENFIKQELGYVKVEINRIICEEKRPPEDELIEIQGELIQAKKKIYSVIESLANALEKRYFKPEIIEKYSSK